MKREVSVLSALAAALVLAAGFALAAGPEPASKVAQAQTQTQEQVYGSQLMTQQERTEYRAKMLAAKTAEAREQLRNEHHEQMKARATSRGVTLPDEVPARGSGMGPAGSGMGLGGGMGSGMGPGMGQGGGMGPGGGRGR